MTLPAAPPHRIAAHHKTPRVDATGNEEARSIWPISGRCETIREAGHEAGVNRDVGENASTETGYCATSRRVARARFSGSRSRADTPRRNANRAGNTFEAPRALVESRMSRSVNAVTMNRGGKSLPRRPSFARTSAIRTGTFATTRWFSRPPRVRNSAHRTAVRPESDQTASASWERTGEIRAIRGSRSSSIQSRPAR